MGCRLLTLIICLTLLTPAIAVQSQDLSAITPENVNDLAIVQRIRPEDFGVPGASIMQFAFHPDNRQLIVGMQGQLHRRHALIGLYDLEQNEAIGLIEDQTFRPTGYRTTGLHFSADAHLLVSTGSAGFIMWDIVQHEFLFNGSPTGMPIITPDNRYLIILADSVAHIWDIQQRREVDRWQFSCDVTRIVMNGQAVECSQRTQHALLVEVYEFPSFDLIESYEAQPVIRFQVTSAVSPDGQLLTHFFPRILDGQSKCFYEIIDRETFSVIESIALDATWCGAPYVTNNTGHLVAYFNQERHVNIYNPITGADMLTLFQPGQYTSQWYEYHFDQEDNYFGILGRTANVLEIYGVADCYVITNHVINLRRGPGTEFDSAVSMQVGERLAVVDQSQQGNHMWLYLAVGLWVRADVVNMQGNC